MTTFAVTTPTFTTKTPVPSASISQNFADVGTLVTNAAAQYRVVASGTSLRTAIGSTANFAAPMGGSAVLISAAGASAGIFLVNPADYGFSPGSQKWCLDSWSQTESAPTSSTLTCALYPVASTSAGVITLGSVITGSSTTTAAITGANTRTVAAGTDFAAGGLNYYVVVFTHSVNPAQTLTYGWTLKTRVV